ncbi:hypothetical protein [Paenibacillus hubeiensis]|uniref:hypothetical protein n=1 Tax=Paenibacillus hubeiensis TaxID=3077330 RepID=UPI0031BA14E7
MKLYEHPLIRWGITLLYPATIFWFSSFGPILHSWVGPIVFGVAFCFLWKGIKEFFISTALTWLVAIPCWWYFIEVPKPSAGAENFAAHLWLIVLVYIGVVMLPQLLILTTRMRIMQYYNIQ